MFFEIGPAVRPTTSLNQLIEIQLESSSVAFLDSFAAENAIDDDAVAFSDPSTVRRRRLANSSLFGGFCCSERSSALASSTSGGERLFSISCAIEAAILAHGGEQRATAIALGSALRHRGA